MNLLLLAATCLPLQLAYFPGHGRDCVEALPNQPTTLCRIDLETLVRERVRPLRKGDYLDILTEAASRNALFCHGHIFYAPPR